jgi:hypothetical protein
MKTSFVALISLFTAAAFAAPAANLINTRAAKVRIEVDNDVLDIASQGDIIANGKPVKITEVFRGLADGLATDATINSGNNAVKCQFFSDPNATEKLGTPIQGVDSETDFNNGKAVDVSKGVVVCKKNSN